MGSSGRGVTQPLYRVCFNAKGIDTASSFALHGRHLIIPEGLTPHCDKLIFPCGCVSD